MIRRGAFWLVASVFIAFLALAPSALAFKVIATSGIGPGKTTQPRGLSVNNGTGRLYVADQGNNRIDAFDSNGDFLFAFGWGVVNGNAEFQICTTTCLKGLDGAGTGQFSQPTSIAVDQSTGDVYVVDFGNLRVQKFDEDGNHILSFGSGSPGHLGSGETPVEGKFYSSQSSGVFIGIDPGGPVYVIDSPSPQFEDFDIRLQKFDPTTGAPIAPQLYPLSEGQATALAVDSTGDFYVGNERNGAKLIKYDSSGTPLDQANTNVSALSVDLANDHLFAAGNVVEEMLPVERISEYDDSLGALANETKVRVFGYGTRLLRGLAPHSSPSGDIYASLASESVHGAGEGVVHLDFPEPGPVIFPEPCKAAPVGNVKATLNARVNPEGKATTFHFEYLTQEKFEAEGNEFKGFEKTSETALPGSADFNLHLASVVAGSEAELTPETQYRCRVVVKSADGEATGQEGTFETKKPFEFEAIWTSEVKGDSARLNAQLNPLGIPTTGAFEYVDDTTFQQSGFDEAEVTPTVSFGAGEAPAIGSTVVSSLVPGILYHYRVLVKNKFDEEGVPCPKDPTLCPGEPPTFRTPRPPGVLPDDRSYELVSPGQKNSAEVAVPGPAGGLFDDQNQRILAAADSGDALTYTSWISFGDAKGAPATSQYLSKRGPDGWGTENISPFGFQRNTFRLAYRGFSPDLTFAGMVVDEPPCGAGAAPGVESLCLRENATGDEQLLTIEPPVVDPDEGPRFCTGFAGVSADGKRAFYAANGAMAEAPVGKGFSLYEWSAGQPLRLVSVLPDGTPATPGATTSFGSIPGGSPCGMGQGVLRHAVSEDGSVAFWTYSGTYLTAERPLFARIDGTETVQLDKVQSGAGKPGKGEFRAASADGSIVYFTSVNRLVTGSNTEPTKPDLYRYDFSKPASERLSNLTTPGLAVGDIKGFIGASEDMSHAYFVGGGVLTGTEENDAGQKAEAGANNLYLYREQSGVGTLRFIGTLSELDGLSGRVSADGQTLAFTSIETEGLLDPSYDNRIAQGGGCQPGLENQLVGDPHCAQAFLYDAQADTLACVSCNPSGARPAGPTELPASSNPFEGPRYLSESGTRLFFESRDTLSPADENERRDVYEFERAGTGSCDAGDNAFEPSMGGCLFLISSGTDSDESYLVDASSDGRDVFFSTRAALLPGRDTNANYDIYDARVAGGFREPIPPPICQGEACKLPPASPPSALAPSTPSFVGPGNVKPKKKKKSTKPKKKSKAGKKKHEKSKASRHHKRGAKR